MSLEPVAYNICRLTEQGISLKSIVQNFLNSDRGSAVVPYTGALAAPYIFCACCKVSPIFFVKRLPSGKKVRWRARWDSNPGPVAPKATAIIRTRPRAPFKGLTRVELSIMGLEWPQSYLLTIYGQIPNITISLAGKASCIRQRTMMDNNCSRNPPRR